MTLPVTTHSVPDWIRRAAQKINDLARRIDMADWYTQVAEGKITGYSIVNKFGENTDIDNGSVPEDVWNGGGLYTGFPTGAAETIEVFSSDANDTSAGTGARTIRVYGLDANYVEQQEDITLNGVTPGVTTNTYMRVHRIYVLTVGSGGVNAGDITCRHTTTTVNVFAILPAGVAQTRLAAFTIPSGKTGYIQRVTAEALGNSSVSVSASLEVRTFGGPFRPVRHYNVNNTFPLVDVIPGGVVATEKSDIVIRIDSTNGANNVDVVAAFDVVLSDN